MTSQAQYASPEPQDLAASRYVAGPRQAAHHRSPATHGSLALDCQAGAGPESGHPKPPVLRLVPPADDPPPVLPDAQAWALRLVQAITEVLAGDRPIGQLVRWTDALVFTDLNRRVRVLGLTTTAGARGAQGRCAVRSVHVSAPAPQVAEVAAHVRHGGRSRAVALRLEVRRGRWVCTALVLG